MSNTLLHLDDVKVHFGGVRAVDGISIDLERGKLYGIVGPNGSGKTTLINAISRFVPLTAGTVSFDGGVLSGMRPFQASRAGLARTFQAIRLLPTLTVRENVLVALDRLGDGRGGSLWRRRPAERRQAEEAADVALERLRLTRLAGEYPANLPYGTQRRVEIARAIAPGPKLLMLDEPIAGMNREERAEIAEIMTELRDDGLTQLLIEHDLRIVLSVSDHIFVMNFGKCVAQGPPRETAARPEVQEAYLGRRHDVRA
jgi:ABC-type branched-subunit amino acid transport system ATPase component